MNSRIPPKRLAAYRLHTFAELPYPLFPGNHFDPFRRDARFAVKAVAESREAARHRAHGVRIFSEVHGKEGAIAVAFCP